KLGEATDSTYPGAGFIGVGLRGTTGRLDNFNGDTFTSAGLPGAPSGLTAAWSGSNIHLSWTPPASDGGSALVEYHLYRGTVSGSEKYVASVGLVTSYDDSGLANGAYFYKIAAVN